MRALNRILAIAAGRNDIVLVALLISIVFMMIIPLPPVLMDVLQAVNLGISVLLLMVAVYIQSPLAFVSFPSLLLLTTLFRLSLGIAATRSILLHADAGQIIRTFGDFVVSGNVVVGAVTFLIITIVQFVVITKGSERVAEVCARFSLDSMPGKQMSVDGDLRAGTIDIREARRRRLAIESESRLYGAMDGAMKFVKGDAIASLINIVVNIVGGITIGSLQKGLGLSEALEVYAILTIGDGLVGQIPALFTAITAGFIVTRVSTEDNGVDLGSAIGNELRAQPRALITGSCILILFSLVPGFPTTIFMTLAGATASLGWLLQRRAPSLYGEGNRNSVNTTAVSTITNGCPEGRQSGADRIALTIPLVVEIGCDVRAMIPLDGLESALGAMRQEHLLDLGGSLPEIIVQADDSRRADEYTIRVNEVPYAGGRVRLGHIVARDTPETLDMLGIPYVAENSFLPQIDHLWVDVAHLPSLRRANIPYWQLAQVIAFHVGYTVRRHADEFIGIQETKALLKQMEASCSELVKEALRLVPLHKISEVLQLLISEEVSIRNMRAILNTLVQKGQIEKETFALAEHVRVALKRQICLRYCTNTNVLAAYSLTSELEDTVHNAIRQNSAGPYLALEPRTAQQIVGTIREAVRPVRRQLCKPVLLASPQSRRCLRKLIEVDLYEVAVLSDRELAPEIAVHVLGRISLQ